MFEVRQLSKTFGALTAVDQVSFRVQEGQTLALIGTSGSGKTTILKMLNRLIEPTDGAILLNDENIRDKPIIELRRQMGYVIQDTGLFPHYTIAENIGLVPGLLGWDKKDTRQRIYKLMERLALAPDIYADKYPHQLSGGQQQRAGIARALAANPPIILMDEPFGALDPITRKDIRREFAELDELANKTTILVTHDVEEAFEMADLICVLDHGRVQQLGTPREILFAPTNDFVRDFVQDKRTQLQLQQIRLADLTGAATSQIATPEKKGQGDLTVQEAIDLMLQQGCDQITTELAGQTYTFTFAQLMEGLQNQQQA